MDDSSESSSSALGVAMVRALDCASPRFSRHLTSASWSQGQGGWVRADTDSGNAKHGADPLLEKGLVADLGDDGGALVGPALGQGGRLPLLAAERRQLRLERRLGQLVVHGLAVQPNGHIRSPGDAPAPRRTVSKR